MGGSGEIYLEIDLDSEFGEAGMQSRPLTADLGEAVVGRRASDWIEIVNMGGPRLVIDQLSIQGPDVTDFTFQLPINPRPLPIPVEFAEEDDRWSLALGEDFWEMPLLVLREDPEQRLTVAEAGDFERRMLLFYGDEAMMENGLIVARDPSATFMPELSQGVHRYAFQTVFDLQALPVELATGDSLRVRISALARTYSTHPLKANLDVRAHPLTDSSNQLQIEVALILRTLWGPSSNVYPTGSFPFHGESARNVLLESVGDQLLLRSWIGFEGRDAGAFQLVSQNPITKVLQPQEAEVFTVEYRIPSGVPCGPGTPLHEAALRIVTDVEVYLIPLIGEPTCPP